MTQLSIRAPARLLLILLLTTILGPWPTAIATPATQARPDPARFEYATDEIIVAVAPNQGEKELRSTLLQPGARDATATINPAAIDPLFSTSRATLLRVELRTGADPLSAAADIATLPDVLWAAPNRIYRGDPRDFTPNDPRYNEQYALPLVGANSAWDLITPGTPSSAIIAVTDDGVSLAHEDLMSGIWVNPGEIPGNGIDDDGNGRIDDINGWDFIGNDNTPNPDLNNNHGTHVAGIAGARLNNALGIAGIAGGAGGARIMPIRFYSNGQAWTSVLVANSFEYVATSGAKILNNSYNIDTFVGDPIVTAALDTLYENGVLVFNSAGNNNELNPPRQVFEQALFVANTDSADIRNSGSNYGTGVDLAAPGTSILSTLPGNTYGLNTGTSMATPMAAGVAALIWSRNPTWTREQVAAQLIGTTDSIDASNPAYVGLLGAGRVNALRALSEALPPPRVGIITGLPAEGGTLSQERTLFSLRLRSILDPTSVVSGSFELGSAGDDTQFGTVDDVLTPLTINGGQPYQLGTNTLNFTLANPLPPGEYRFTVRAGGLRDPFGQALDGNGDGNGGDAIIRNFSVRYQVSGHVYEDWEGDGVRDADDPALANELIFLDLNSNSVRDSGESTIASSNVPRSIPDNNRTGITSTLSLENNALQVTDVNVTLNINHQWTGDLRLSLSSPSGSSISLANNRGQGANFTNTIFDDAAASAISSGSAPYTGSFRPETPLSAINSEIVQGTWGLRAIDTLADISGSITAWSLTLGLREPSAFSDSAGRYWFSGLPAGNYTLRIAPNSGWQPIGTLTRGVAAEADSTPMAVQAFGLVQSNAIYGRTYIDLNSNNVRDSGEPGLASATVYVDANNNSQLDAGEVRTLSDAAGRYRLSGLTPGAKTLRQVPIAGYPQVTPTTALQITLAPGATITGQHFGNADGVAPTVALTAAPAGTAAFDSVTIAFSEVVSGFSLANLALTRNGQPIALQGAQLSGSGATFVLSGLSGLTQATGIYRLRLEGAGSGIADLSGNALVVEAEIVGRVGPTLYLPIMIIAQPA